MGTMTMTTMTTTKLTDIIARAEREGWTRLYLGNTRIGDAGAAALAEATGLKEIGRAHV